MFIFWLKLTLRALVMTVNLSPPSPGRFLHQVVDSSASDLFSNNIIYKSPPTKIIVKALKLLCVAAVRLYDVREELTAGRSVN